MFLLLRSVTARLLMYVCCMYTCMLYVHLFLVYLVVVHVYEKLTHISPPVTPVTLSTSVLCMYKITILRKMS